MLGLLFGRILHRLILLCGFGAGGGLLFFDIVILGFHRHRRHLQAMQQATKMIIKGIVNIVNHE